MKKIKTIDLTVREWFDRANGNSYFSAMINIDFSLPSQRVIYLPFQYGYGNHSEDMAKEALIKDGFLNMSSQCLSMALREKHIIYRYFKIENCRKRDVVEFGRA